VEECQKRADHKGDMLRQISSVGLIGRGGGKEERAFCSDKRAVEKARGVQARGRPKKKK